MWATERNNTLECNSKMTQHTLELLSHIDAEVCTGLLNILEDAETKLHNFTYDMLPKVIAKPVSNKSVGDTHHLELHYSSIKEVSELLSTKTIPDLFVYVTINNFTVSQHILVRSIEDLPQATAIINDQLSYTIINILNRRQ